MAMHTAQDGLFYTPFGELMFLIFTDTHLTAQLVRAFTAVWSAPASSCEVAEHGTQEACVRQSPIGWPCKALGLEHLFMTRLHDEEGYVDCSIETKSSCTWTKT